MTKTTDQPLRGDAAWQAAKAQIAERNDAARARGAKVRAASEAAKVARQRAADAREHARLPEQPRP